jgi:cyclic pyranopterin monophosphate synthase
MGNKVVGGRSLSHVDATGTVRMVDVSGKEVTAREAVAGGRISMSRQAIRQIRAGAIKKGDPLQTARLAGIMAAKRTAELIPLCHPLPLTFVDVTLTERRDGYDLEARVRTSAQTGVEMEALTAVSVAALTIYDMVKAVDKAMVIEGVRLLEKRGGRSGEYRLTPPALSERGGKRVEGRTRLRQGSGGQARETRK